jgi:hypothetical protein
MAATAENRKIFIESVLAYIKYVAVQCIYYVKILNIICGLTLGNTVLMAWI